MITSVQINRSLLVLALVADVIVHQDREELLRRLGGVYEGGRDVEFDGAGSSSMPLVDGSLLAKHARDPGSELRAIDCEAARREWSARER